MTKSTKKRLEFFAWYPFDYAADTSHLSPVADLAYRRILDEIFKTAQDTCRIPADDDYLITVARTTVDKWPAIQRALISGAKPLLQKRGRWISQPRLTEEIRKAQKKSQQAADAVAERDRKRNGGSSDDDRPINGGSSSKSKSKKSPSDSKRKTRDSNHVVVKTGPIDQSRIDCIESVRLVFAPSCRLSAEDVAELIHRHGDEWQIAGAMIEKHPYLVEKNFPYVDEMLRNRTEPIESAKDYVEARLAAVFAIGGCCDLHPLRAHA